MKFTVGQRRVLEQLSRGLTNKEIGYRLGLTEGTVKIYLSQMMQVAKCNSRFHLALFYLGKTVVDMGERNLGSE